MTNQNEESKKEVLTKDTEVFEEKMNNLQNKRIALKKQLKIFFAITEQQIYDILLLRERNGSISGIWVSYEDVTIELDCLLTQLQKASDLKELQTNSEVYEQLYYTVRAKARQLLQPLLEPKVEAKQEESMSQNQT